MLDALELAGFKSFPDRTRFDFPPGITVVVGPNGSGKSNIVDAIKWVLGEQSAKSLRGKEMSDVIFKGSGGPSGRRPSNSAEATIYLSNHEGRLRIDQTEISVTRRVYRSGESEYLINGEPCRLKDIRNLFRGTGIGVDAYSLIEQGKVDKVLQASAKDRRAMFEEAAGISRFKAKKIETERRLARVEQNLIRLADIVEEVESHYKRIKNQATKAAKYKEYTDRLKSLRTFVGQKDWRDFSRTLQEILATKDGLNDFLQEHQQELATREAESEELDRKLSKSTSGVTEVQTELGELLQGIAERQSKISLTQTRIEDGVSQSRQLRESLDQLSMRIHEGERSIAESRTEFGDAEGQLSRIRADLEVADEQLTATSEEIEQLKQELETGRQKHQECTQSVSELQQHLSAGKSEQAGFVQASERLSGLLDRVAQSLSEKRNQLEQASREQEQFKQQAEEKDSTLRVARERLDRLKSELASEKKQLDQWHREQVGATQRAELIQELENQQAGLDSGVKELMSRAQGDESEIYQDVVGLVADLIKVNIEYAELIDLALGDSAQHVVIKSPRLIQALADGQIRLSGRVGMVLLNPDRELELPEKTLQDQPGVVGRLDQLVHAHVDHHPVIRHLLGNTWLVKSLSVALENRQRASHSWTRFVTLDGAVVEADGSVISGARVGAAGIVSRRSELRAIHRKIHELVGDIERSEQKTRQQQDAVDDQEAKIELLLTEHSEISAKLNESRTQASLLQNTIDGFSADQASHQEELQEVQHQQDSVSKRLEEWHGQLQRGQAELLGITNRIQQNETRLVELEGQRGQLEQQVTSNKVNLAKSEQRVADFHSRLDFLNGQLTEQSETKLATRQQVASLLWQRRTATRSLEEMQIELEELTQRKSDLDKRLEDLNEIRRQSEEQRQGQTKQLNELRDQIRVKQEQLHEYLMREKDLSMQRTQLAERLRDDYDIDIEQLQDQDAELDDDRAAIDQEINDLRKKLNNIGPVNMDALSELESVEERFSSLNDQYQDLVAAKESLEKIIVRINNDSRKLFLDTLEQIRANFQTLFRQTFGGGKADLLIEEGVDVLEAGIEITATPPGKPEFNNSLLSGGEKALTAVSLLMAIFKFRPSPFCILDEVDAPFDEANVGRFIETLKSFLGWTKFIIVTHSKKTMTAANTLYGVTMQESGVSKRVSVQFEDVNERGEISAQAVERDDSSHDGDQLGVA